MPTSEGQNQVFNLMDALEADLWRESVGFSTDVATALADTENPSVPEAEVTATLESWLGENQPCLFGRAAAKKHLLTFCVLRGDDLRSDRLIRDKIQDGRLEWKQRAFRGESSGFIIAVLSERLARAKPSTAVRDIAARICALYLDRERVEVDEILLDHICLEQPGYSPIAWEWVTGVNYFSAQADKRWWHDHRMPVGMAFSVNSVGHMVRSGRLGSKLHDVDTSMGTIDSDEEFRQQKIDSLEQALLFAMKTISLAADGPSGKATELLSTSADVNNNIQCPIKLPQPLADKDFCTYRGYYHTDVTLPSEYFVPNVDRPAGLRQHELDFTYLFDSSLDNPDYARMGEGRRIRSSDGSSEPVSGRPYRSQKRLRAIEAEVDIRNLPHFAQALKEGKNQTK